MAKFTLVYFIVTLLQLPLAHGQMILPPPNLREDEEVRSAFIDQILEDMPSLPSETYDRQKIESYILLMDNLLDRLRNSGQFTRWAAERPPLQNFRFTAYHTETKDRYLITEDFLRDLTAFFQANYESRLERDAMVFEQELKERILRLAAEGATISSQGLIAGLASVFPPERRREILAQRSLALRASSLIGALKDVSQEGLRASFQSERFSIPRESLTKRKAINLLNKCVARELELIRLVSLMEIHARTSELGPDTIQAENIDWFNGEGNLEFLKDLGVDDRAIAVIERLRANARGSFTSTIPGSAVEVEDMSIIVREVPAHLAVFRGCSGGDCSTSDSWAYPFSPKERNFYVYVEGTEFQEIGYVSGNITRVRGRDALFLRDLTGKRMAPEHIDMLIQGFAQLLDAYGVDQMTIAHPNFHSSQNHFPPLYLRINEILEHLQTVRQSFPDSGMRTRYLDLVVKTTSYDRASTHALVKLYEAEKVTPHTLSVKVEPLPADYFDIALARKPTGRETLLRLQMALTADHTGILANSDYLGGREWGNIPKIWLNEDRVSVEQYYARVRVELERIGLNLSRSLIREFYDLFYQGHINAPNAFVTDDPDLLDLGYRLVTDRFFRQNDTEVFRAHPDLKFENIFKHPAFVRQVMQIFERRRPQDWGRLSNLLRMGFVFDFPLTEEQVDLLLNYGNPTSDYTAAANTLRTLYAQGWRDNYPALVASYSANSISWWNGNNWIEGALEETLPIAKILAQIEIDPTTPTNIATLDTLGMIATYHSDIEVRFLAAVSVLRAKLNLGSYESEKLADFVEKAFKKPVDGQSVSEESKEIGRPVLERYRRATCADKVAS